MICLMAQMGSYVPAESARLSVVDRIFTRVGASDDLAGGQSILYGRDGGSFQYPPPRDLVQPVILDEIGRGTSTYDGLSIAWAVVEYISDKKNNRGKNPCSRHIIMS